MALTYYENNSLQSVSISCISSNVHIFDVLSLLLLKQTVAAAIYRPFVVAAELVHPAVVPNAHHLIIKVAIVEAFSYECCCHLASFHRMVNTLTLQM